MKRMCMAALLFAAACAALGAQSAGKGVSLDIGTEPEEAGNISYAMVQYGWSERAASRLDIRYTVQAETDYAVSGYENAVDTHKTNRFELDVLPLVRYFGMDGAGRELGWSMGLSYQFSYEDERAGMFDADGIMLDEGDEGKYFTVRNKKRVHVVAPRLGLAARLPLSPLLAVRFEGFVHPFYCLFLQQDMAYHSDQTAAPFDYSGTNRLWRVSSPYVSLKASLGVTRLFRLAAALSYQRLDFQQMDWASDWNSLTGYDDMQQLTSFRAGVELVPSLSAGARTDARVRMGVYRQTDWFASSYTGDRERESRWVLCGGFEL